MARHSQRETRLMSLKNNGTKRVAKNMAARVPPITVMPMAWRLLAHAPVLIARGSVPRTKAMEVIRLGRKHVSVANRTALEKEESFRQGPITKSV